jgi:hypothetical protein
MAAAVIGADVSRRTRRADGLDVSGESMPGIPRHRISSFANLSVRMP